MDFEQHLKDVQENFHKFEIKVPAVDYPPRCFSYRNRQGVQIQTGYYWKIIETFVMRHNGTLRYDFFDMWAMNFSLESVAHLIANEGHSFTTSVVIPQEYFESSDAIHFGKNYLLTATGKEIPQNMYLLITFSVEMWLMVISVFVILFLLLMMTKQRYRYIIDISGTLLDTLKIMIFQYDGILRDKTIFTFMLSLIFLGIGLFSTVSYSSNLSSMYVSRIYEPDLQSLGDISHTDLRIQLFSLDYHHYMKLENLPQIVYGRMFAGNDTEFQENRQHLKLPHILMVMDDVMEFLLFQQNFMLRPIAKYIPEPFYTMPLYVSMPHRSPFLDSFNRYISYIHDNGTKSFIVTGVFAICIRNVVYRIANCIA
uniref:Ionotropic glutamate receptor C-terminal domain-containing protein n=1 Tax=Musca domestica TaxID=7370 RepID=A0A1I8N5C6_MUSDO